MFRFVRAAAYAAASLSITLGAAYARPSLAEELKPEPINIKYLDHSLAGIEPTRALDGDAGPTGYRPIAPDSTDEAPAGPAPAPTKRKVLEQPLRLSLPALVRSYASGESPDREHECLAGAVYFESKGEPLQGQLAVAEVILNRAASGKFPTTICGVVTQKSQFSFVRGGRIPPIAKGSDAWRKAVAIAHIAKKELAEGGIGNAMFFHARYVSPQWRLTRVASIGNHIFYR